jgi:hypothetical protein
MGFSLDGIRLAAVEASGTVRIWAVRPRGGRAAADAREHGRRWRGDGEPD